MTAQPSATVAPVTRVIGIDTSLRATGVGVVESAGAALKALAWDVLRNPASRSHSECLLRIERGLGELIAATRPQAAAIEGIFHCKNVRVAVILGQARGVALACCARAGIPVYEYAPRSMKQAIVGYGGAGKDQVGRMIVRLLSLNEAPPEDAADALGLAICHLQNKIRLALGSAKPI
jgi:crossover junction endodeoxyribonuclease RuvC